MTVTDSAGVARPAPLYYRLAVADQFRDSGRHGHGNSDGDDPESEWDYSVRSYLNRQRFAGDLRVKWLGAGGGLGSAGDFRRAATFTAGVAVVAGAVVPLPISLGPSTEQIYLEMYGTGIRNAKNVTVTVGGLSVPVLYAGAAPGYAGEDQVNIGPLPPALAGQGSVNIIVTADGQQANAVTVTIQ